MDPGRIVTRGKTSVWCHFSQIEGEIPYLTEEVDLISIPFFAVVIGNVEIAV
jgi:hypothetical protein